MTSNPAEYFRSKSILVTGGAGFIGSHLVETLVAAGARVAVIDNLQAGLWSNLDAVASEVRFVEGDVRDYSALASLIRDTDPEYVIHLAANASVPGSVDDPRYDFESNCGGTVALLDSLRMAGSKAKVVIASSAAVYGEPGRFPITETFPLAPISPYGASKVCAEVEGAMWAKVYGTQVVVARLFNTYGPRMPRFVVFDFLQKLEADSGRLEILGDGKQVRDFNYVSDTVAGLLTLARVGVSGQAYNVASGVSHTVTDLAQLLLGILGLKDRTRIEYTGSSWVGDAQRWEVDVAKIHALGHSTDVDLEQGLRLVVDWYGFEPS